MAAATDPGEIAVAASNYIGRFEGPGKQSPAQSELFRR
jgi:hypothetical protein